MNINELAAEMKAVAVEHPINVLQMMQAIETRQFPNELKRVVDVEDFGLMHVQYSHDSLSEGKYIRHLSFSREDLTRPSDEVQQAFHRAFFGEEAVLPLPSMHPHVVQMGVLSKTS